MSIKIIALFAFLICVGFVSAETFGETEWNNTDKTVWNDTNTWSILSETIAEFDVVADMSATELWAQVNLSTDKIDFGKVERENIYNRTYTISARGNVDIRVIPELTNVEDKVFSNLWFSRISSDPKKKLGNYEMIFNLTQNKGIWSVLGSGDEIKNITGQTKGSQVIWLDMRSFSGVIPFDEPYQNTVKFRIVPVRADDPNI